jgi:hypothetical protein
VDSGGDSSSSRAGRGGAECADARRPKASTPLYRLCRKNGHFLARKALGPLREAGGQPTACLSQCGARSKHIREGRQQDGRYSPYQLGPGRAGQSSPSPSAGARCRGSPLWLGERYRFFVFHTKTRPRRAETMNCQPGVVAPGSNPEAGEKSSNTEVPMIAALDQRSASVLSPSDARTGRSSRTGRSDSAPPMTPTRATATMANKKLSRPATA